MTYNHAQMNAYRAVYNSARSMANYCRQNADWISWSHYMHCAKNAKAALKEHATMVHLELILKGATKA